MPKTYTITDKYSFDSCNATSKTLHQQKYFLLVTKERTLIFSISTGELIQSDLLLLITVCTRVHVCFNVIY